MGLYKHPLGSRIGEGDGTPLRYSCLETPMDGGAWRGTVHGVTKSQTWLSNFTLTFYYHALEKAMAPHSSTLAWKLPWTEELGGLLSLGSHRVGHNWSDLAAAAATAGSRIRKTESEVWWGDEEFNFGLVKSFVWRSFHRELGIQV